MARRRFLVAYDIRDAKRLRKVHKAMKGFGEPLQYSVFICDLDAMEKISMVQVVGDIIEHRIDSVAIVELGELNSPTSERFEFMGASRPLPRRGARII